MRQFHTVHPPQRLAFHNMQTIIVDTLHDDGMTMIIQRTRAREREKINTIQIYGSVFRLESELL